MGSMLFYVWGLLAIYYELWSMKKQNMLYTRQVEEKLLLPKDQMEKVLKSEDSIFVLLMAGYGAWTVLGFLASSQSFGFFLILCLSGISYYMNKKYSKTEEDVFNTWCIVDSIFSLLALSFIFINKYQLHIPMWKTIWNSIT